MADKGQLRILQEGVDAWNRWRREHPRIRPRLSEACLPQAFLAEADLSGANLQGAELQGADLSGADLREANLSGADLLGAELHAADLSEADLLGTNLSEVQLHGADFQAADLSGGDLFRANAFRVNLGAARLTGANLRETHFHGAELDGADFNDAKVGFTVFADVNLSAAKGLESVKHYGPSTIGIDTIYASHGRIPEAFLRGAGVPDEFITYMWSLVGRAIGFYSCFISYSSRDQEFAERLYADLQAKAVRCWFAPEDMKIGDKILDRLDRSIRLHDKLLLILSSHSIGSEWVEDEVTTAFEEERKRGKTVLFPVRLDDAVMETDEAWAAKVRGRHIGDFRKWKEHDAYQRGLTRLLRDLKASQQSKPPTGDTVLSRETDRQ